MVLSMTEAMERVRVTIIRILAFILFGLAILFPQTAAAHAVLIQADPPPNSHLSAPPEKITLKFNERLEKELYFIRVYDGRGKSVSDNSATMSLDQKELSLKLPYLPDGVYTVSYRVMSADGHPVEEAYIMTVGNAAESGDAWTGLNDNREHAHGGIAERINRMLYYLSLLLLTGWLFWGRLHRFASREAQDEYRFWLKYLKMFYLFMLIAIGIVQMITFLDGFGFGEIRKLLLGTTFGAYWIVSLLVTVLGILLRPRKWFDFAWITILWIAEAFNGHAVSFEPIAYSVFLDAVHLAAAAVWAGGLLLILLLWKKDKEAVKSFMLSFSKWALISMLALIGTGSLLSFVFMPELSYLPETEWGIWLLIKTSLVVLVIPVAAVLRSANRKHRDESFRRWLKREFMLMLLIVLAAGSLTYASPFPSNAPFDWQESKNNIKIQSAIRPNNPGVENSFEVRVQMPERKNNPKRVEMWLRYLDQPEIAPIQVPLNRENAVSGNGNEGSFFHADGAYLPVPGRWRVELRIMDMEDNETVFAKEIRLYPVKKESESDIPD